MFSKKIINFNFFSKGIKKRGRTIRLPFMMKFTEIAKERSSKLRGCNMSFWREDFIKINGFNEDYVLPAIGEDIDLTWRFEGMGYHLYSLRNFAVQYHLYHKENWSDQSVNEAIMKENQRLKRYVTLNGLKKLEEN